MNIKFNMLIAVLWISAITIGIIMCSILYYMGYMLLEYPNSQIWRKRAKITGSIFLGYLGAVFILFMMGNMFNH